MNKTTKKIVIVGLIGVIVFFLYRAFAPKGNTSPASETKNGLTVSNGDATTSVKKENIQELLSLLLSINGIKLSGDIFARSEFTSLKDFSLAEAEQHLDESVGRNNPFLPIGDESSGQYVTADSTTPTGYLKTNPVTSLTLSTALLVGENTLSHTLEQYFEWSKIATGPFDNRTPVMTKGANSTFSYTLTNLTPNTIYYYRSVVKAQDGQITTGNVQSFKTPKL